MDQELDYERTESFWEWFEDNEKWIRNILEDEAHPDREDLVQILNNKVLQFGMFSWELGRGKQRPYFLTISPNRDPELLALSRQIINLSPDLTYWEFNDAKPANEEWDLKFHLFDDDLNEWRINATSWKFIFQPAPGNKAKVVILAKNIDQLDNDTRQSAGELAVSTLLGEALMIEHVLAVEVVNELKQAKGIAPASIIEIKPLLEEFLDLPDDYS